MSRSARLLPLLQLLRRRRHPVTAAALAGELGASERTIYRGEVTLAAQGVPVEGKAGLGYVLRPGFLLLPFMFGDDEIEALVLGCDGWRAAETVRSAPPRPTPRPRARPCCRPDRGAGGDARRRLARPGTGRSVPDLRHVRLGVGRHARSVVSARRGAGRGAPTGLGGSGEFAFTVADGAVVRAMHEDCVGRGSTVVQTPTEMDFGHTSVVLDPGGHRSRVFAPAPA